MLCFLPWATLTEPVHVGAFYLTPVSSALDDGEIPAAQVAAVETILEAYGHRRPVDRQEVPLLRRPGLGITADLTDEQVAEYFEFRIRLTFSVLGARRFFSHPYCNSDNIRLVIQGFTPERAGGALLRHRRRDGSTRIIVPPGNLSVSRPHHVSDWCELPRNMDRGLLEAMEIASEREELWGRLGEAARLFVGANTDSPDVSIHAELIDTISAFSRMANEWDEKGTVSHFAKSLPPPATPVDDFNGAKATHPRVKAAIGTGDSVRALWLKDGYILRSQFGHGRVEAPGYSSIWTEREHLLLSAVAFPLYAKAILEKEGLYEMSAHDVIMDRAFDQLVLIEPFAQVGEDKKVPWNTVVGEVQMQAFAERLERELDGTAELERTEEDAN